MYIYWKWQPTPVFLPGESQGQGSLVSCHLWGRTESDTTEQLHFHFHTLEKEMTTHSSVLAWRIPGTGEPGELPSMGLQTRTRLKQLSSSQKEYSCSHFEFRLLAFSTEREKKKMCTALCLRTDGICYSRVRQ